MNHKIILALDVDTLKKARYFINELYPKIKIFKVGLQIFSLAGKEIIQYIQSKGGEVFLDLKFFDIPNTVASAVRQAVKLKVKMLTLHILGGKEMLRLAVKAAKEEARICKVKQPLLIGVTVLTSQETRPEQVLKLAKIGRECGLDGVVCSVKEAALVRKKIGSKFLIITPGIRPSCAAADDQKRAATVKEAFAAGSNFLVIGRPILKAKDPLEALKGLLN